MSTKIEYIYKLMKDQNINCFCIYDVKDTLLYNQKNVQFSVEKSIQEIEEFLQYNKGTFRIELRDDPDKNKPGVDLCSYSVINVEENRPNESITGPGIVTPGMFGVPTGNDFFALLQQREQELRQAHAEGLAKTMEHLREKHELTLKLMAKDAEIQNAKGQDNFQQIAMAGLQSLLGGGMNVGVSGIGDSAQSDNERINSAVRTLLKLDPNFVDNIESLSKLALEKPSIYKMAVNQLNLL